MRIYLFLGVEDSRSLGFQAPIEDEEYEYLEQEEGHTTELDYVTTSRLKDKCINVYYVDKSICVIFLYPSSRFSVFSLGSWLKQFSLRGEKNMANVESANHKIV